MTIVLYQFYFNFFILVPCNLFLNLDAIGYIIHISHLPPLLYWPSQIVRSNIITASVFECLRQYPLIFFLCLSFMTTLGAILEELAVCVKKRKEVKSSLIIYATLRGNDDRAIFGALDGIHLDQDAIPLPCAWVLSGYLFRHRDLYPRFVQHCAICSGEIGKLVKYVDKLHRWWSTGREDFSYKYQIIANPSNSRWGGKFYTN